MTHLIIIGQRRACTDAFAGFEQAELVQTTDGEVVRRVCHDGADLVATVRDVVERYGPLVVLDLLDHAGPGRQQLGDELVFWSDDDPCSELGGRELAEQLAPYLANTAHVRLLGCSTAKAPTDQSVDGTAAAARAGFPDAVALSVAGRLLLFKLARALGERRIAFGTIRPTHARDFERGVLKRRKEHELLYSSLTAIDIAAPGFAERLSSLALVAGDSCEIEAAVPAGSAAAIAVAMGS